MTSEEFTAHQLQDLLTSLKAFPYRAVTSPSRRRVWRLQLHSTEHALLDARGIDGPLPDLVVDTIGPLPSYLDVVDYDPRATLSATAPVRVQTVGTHPVIRLGNGLHHIPGTSISDLVG